MEVLGGVTTPPLLLCFAELHKPGGCFGSLAQDRLSSFLSILAAPVLLDMDDQMGADKLVLDFCFLAWIFPSSLGNTFLPIA